MTLKRVAAIVSLGAALTFSASETFAGSAVAGKGAPTAAPFVRPGVPIGPKPFAHPHHHRRVIGGLWPAGGYYYGGAPYGELPAEVGIPSNDINYTYTYKQDVPWDWAHRYPPMVAPSDRPYVPACSSEPVTVGGRSGEQTVNVIRCY